jgi:2-polyprenyl-3-methyl-5-hydroxy-6-metoxy-1,4-benzoquinol methylase
MQRIVEPELMSNALQVQAYASADFSEPNSLFVDLLKQYHGGEIQGQCLDLGCGPGDICFRMARQFPQMHITGIDGSENMLASARHASDREELNDRLRFEQHVLPSNELPAKHFDVVTSNSLLHHLHNPEVLWQTIRQCCKPGGIIHIMDLYRPESEEKAQSIVETYAKDEADILKEDFYHSLLAAFTPDEVSAQLRQTAMGHLLIDIISDRHLLVHGHL